MKPTTPAVLLSCLLTAAAAAAQAPLYTNAELVSFDAGTRMLVVRTNDGHSRTMKLDDGVAGFAGLRQGDEVILAVRAEPGLPRVSRIIKSAAAAPASRPRRELGTVAAPGTTARRPRAAGEPAPALEAFSSRVAALAQQAGYVDQLWASFASACDATVRARYDRDWFSLWDTGGVDSDLSTGFCRDLFNQVVARGESVKAGMSAAEESAREASLLPGNIRDVRRRYAMDWDGWDRTPPARQTP